MAVTVVVLVVVVVVVVALGTVGCGDKYWRLFLWWCWCWWLNCYGGGERCWWLWLHCCHGVGENGRCVCVPVSVATTLTTNNTYVTNATSTVLLKTVPLPLLLPPPVTHITQTPVLLPPNPPSHYHLHHHYR